MVPHSTLEVPLWDCCFPVDLAGAYQCFSASGYVIFSYVLDHVLGHPKQMKPGFVHVVKQTYQKNSIPI